MTNDRKELSNITFSRDAADYDQSSRYAPLRECYAGIVTEAFDSSIRTVLDVGCGTGALLSMIHKQQRSIKLFGIDLSQEMIKISEARLPRGTDLKVSDSENIPFKDGTFDLVLQPLSCEWHHSAE